MSETRRNLSREARIAIAECIGFLDAVVDAKTPNARELCPLGLIRIVHLANGETPMEATDQQIDAMLVAARAFGITDAVQAAGARE